MLRASFLAVLGCLALFCGSGALAAARRAKFGRFGGLAGLRFAVETIKNNDMTLEELNKLTNSEMTPEKFAEFVAGHQWKSSTSKAYEKLPHSYLIRERARNQDEFTQAVKFVRQHGTKKPFFRTWYIYLTVGVWSYWTMHEPAETAGIINRCDAKK